MVKSVVLALSVFQNVHIKRGPLFSSTDEMASVYGIDLPGKRSQKFASMVVAPARAREVAGFGYKMTCAEALTPALTSQIKALAQDSILSFMVVNSQRFNKVC